jgi:hypothetical protein
MQRPLKKQQVTPPLFDSLLQTACMGAVSCNVVWHASFTRLVPKGHRTIKGYVVGRQNSLQHGQNLELDLR